MTIYRDQLQDEITQLLGIPRREWALWKINEKSQCQIADLYTGDIKLNFSTVRNDDENTNINSSLDASALAGASDLKVGKKASKKKKN